MLIHQVIEEFAAAGIYLTVQDGKLLCKASAGALTPERRSLIADRKADFIAFLRQDVGEQREDEPPLVRRPAGPALLSPTQQRLWFIDQLTESDANYTIPVTYRLVGSLDTQALGRALQRVVERHEILRTVIELRNEEPVAVVMSEQFDIRLVAEDLTDLDAASQEAAVSARMQEAVARPFDLAHEPPLRTQLLRLAPDAHVLLLTMHHIASDGWSVENLLREISTLYTAFRDEKADPLPPLSLQYGDYAAWQRQWLQGDRLHRSLEYWRKQLEGVPVTHSLPLDRPRPAHVLNAGASWRQCLPPSLHQALLELSRRQGTTLFMTLQTAFAVFVARWSGESDIVIGTPVANRPRNELAPLIGFFSNTLALRTTVPGDASFADILQQTKTVALGAYEFQHLPFDMLVEDINPPRSLGLAPLVQLMFSLQDIDEDAALILPGISAEALIPDSVNAKFDLNLSLFERPHGLEACWDYSSALFDADTIVRMAGSFENLLQGIVAGPTQHTEQLPLLDAAAQRAMLALGSEAATARFDRHCLHTLFERQVERSPNAVAATFDKASLTYAELNHNANQLAHHLRKLGVGPDVLVAIAVERGLAMVTGLLAIIKAGGAYVPLDPAYPVDRLAYMLEDSAPAALMTQQSLLDRLPPVNLPILFLEDNAAWADEPSHNPDVAGLTPAHLAYVIYTSGSTGKPKGVMVEHGSVSRLLASTEMHFHFDASDVWTLFHSFAFDFSVWELWGALAYGGRLVVVPLSCARSPDDFYALLCREQVTVLNQTPSAFRALIGAQDSTSHQLRCIIFGGEALELHTLAPWVERNDPQRTRLINMYGITEITVHATFKELTQADIEADRGSLIGHALSDLRIYLLDSQRRPVPVGMPGEMYVGGPGVARGYLNRADLTAERFLTDPFQADPAARMYKSGDLGKWSNDGQLEYLGRNDFQVKIRGFRIELGEIEARLTACAGVRQAVVIAREDQPGNKRLVAYVIAHEGHEPSVAKLRDELTKSLADYMVPSAFVALRVFPLTPNGKLDRAALPAPDQASVVVRHYDAPTGDVEIALAAIWQELLGVSRIGRNDNFFELGGHSLLLTRLHNQLGARYGVEVALKRLFAAQSIREQAALIELPPGHAVTEASPAPRPRPAEADSVLSFAQRRLWFIDRMGGAGAVYNIPCALRLIGSLQPDALRHSLESIVRRHEVLRTPMVAVGSEFQLRCIDSFELDMPLHDLRNLDGQARPTAVQAHLDAEASRPFDLATDLFLRARLLRVADDDHILLLTLHHIAADGWSMVVLLQELAELYEARIENRDAALPALPLQYADYAHWQQQWLQGERLETQLHYWQRQLAALPVLHNLPLDYVRPDAQRYRGALHRQTLDETLLVELKRLARAHDATLFMTLQAAFAVWLARWSGDTDIVVGTPIANRRHEELAPLIGFFVNTLVLRNDLAGNPRFTDALVAAREVALDAFQHQDVPFEMLVDRLRPQRSLSHSPLFQVMFSLDTNDAAVIPFGGLDVVDVAGESHHAKFDLTLSMQETPDGLEACWDYNRDLFRADTVARMGASFETLLQGIVATPTQRIERLPLLDEAMQREVTAFASQAAMPGFDRCCVHALIERQVERSPNAIAVTFEKEALTYAQLNRHANQLAHHLRKLGVGPDVPVAIAVERGLAMVTGLLAILKAGGAYVPLDPAYPEDRLAYMLEDSAPAALLTQRSVLDRLPVVNIPTLLLDDTVPWMHEPSHNPDIADLHPAHLAYVIYTSGSTGRPKGVMNEHGGVVNRLLWAQSQFQLSSTDRVLQKTPFGFDVSVWEFFLPLLAGAQLVMAKPGGHQDPGYLAELIERADITMLHFVPSMLQVFLDGAQAARCSGLRHVLCSGEALPYPLQVRFQKVLPEVALHNLYGPTEAAVDVTYWRCDASLHPGIVPIGRPVANTRMYVLDGHRAAMPRGVAGELYIGGIQVARGYLNRPELTAERFLADPFVDDPDARMYRTGDLGRWLPDGSIEYLGRNDFQVKIRGFRIELGEVEGALTACEGVREAVVIAREDMAGDKRLVAYLVAQEGHTLENADLRRALGESLPEYMVPNAFVQLENLPLTPNGKLDRHALPVPETSAYTSATYIPPETPAERQLVSLWQDLLQHERISVTANFFDLGGHSLNAVRLMSAIHQATGRVLPISILFRAPTIRALAVQMETYLAVADESFVTLREKGEGAPLFVFHAAGGDVLCYQPLLKYLPPDMPVHGFHRSELPNQRVPMFKSVEQLAGEYIEQILERQPRGPYYLAGWSSGGLIAMEVASHLEDKGETVAMVAVIDSMLSTGTDVAAEYHEKGLPSLQQLSSEEACEFMREYDPELPPVAPVNGVLEISATDYFNYLVAANQIGLDFHQPCFRLAARVHYFGCTLNRNVRTEEQRIAEIQALVEQPISHESFEATHFSIMEEPSVAELGCAMAATIERSRKEEAAHSPAPSPQATDFLQETVA